MALSQTALVLESNGKTFFRGNNVLTAGDEIGLSAQVPTPDGGGNPEGDFWATPVNDQGIVTGINFSPYNPLSSLPAKPKPYSLPACKIRRQGGINSSEDYWFVLGTSAQWAAGTLPTQSSLVFWPASQQASQKTNASTGIPISGSWKFVLGLPTLDGSPHQHLFPKGWYNGTALTAAAGAGYANVAALLVFLNANWTTMGSPSITVSWALNTNGTAIIGTFTDNEADQLVVPSTHVLDASIWAIV